MCPSCTGNPHLQISAPLEEEVDMTIPVKVILPKRFRDLTELFWAKNGSIIDIEKLEKYKGGTIHEPTLTICNFSDEDKGKYTCEIRNKYGRDKQECEIGNKILLKIKTDIDADGVDSERCEEALPLLRDKINSNCETADDECRGFVIKRQRLQEQSGASRVYAENGSICFVYEYFSEKVAAEFESEVKLGDKKWKKAVSEIILNKKFFERFKIDFTCVRWKAKELKKTVGNETVDLELPSPICGSYKDLVDENEKAFPEIVPTKRISLVISGLRSIYHISWASADNFWTSDCNTIVQTNQSAEKKHTLKIRGAVIGGRHALSNTGTLCYITNNEIKAFHPEKGTDMPLHKYTREITSETRRPSSIICSFDGDIIVGYQMTLSEDKNTVIDNANVTRYTFSELHGTKTQRIEKDQDGKDLFVNPFYMAENINGNICISDRGKREVIVLKSTGEHRFTFKDWESPSTFSPHGICTDDLGHIFICSTRDKSIYLLNQAGHFLSRLLTAKHGLRDPLSICADKSGNVYIGQQGTNKISVYNYMEHT